MRALKPRTGSGFTLIELIVTVAIIAILATIAIRAYASTERAAHRTDATSALVNYAQTLERCYSQYYYYSGTPDCPAPASGTLTPAGYYTITPTRTATTYTFTAKPVAGGAQAKDTSCAKFSIDQTGSKTAFTSGGVANNSTCWGG